MSLKHKPNHRARVAALMDFSQLNGWFRLKFRLRPPTPTLVSGHGLRSNLPTQESPMRTWLPLVASLVLVPPVPAQDRKPSRFFAEAEGFTIQSGRNVLPDRDND